MNNRTVVAVLAASTVGAAAVLGTSISVTEAQRNQSQHAATEFSVTVEQALDLEGSVDGVTWTSDAEEVTQLQFTPDQMALRVGQENAVYAPMQVRTAAGSNVGATATVEETGLGGSDFANSLRGHIYFGAATCDAAGVAGVQRLTEDPLLAGQVSGEFDVAAPENEGAPGQATELCVQVWLNDNNWLLGGTAPPTETATWTVTGTAQ